MLSIPLLAGDAACADHIDLVDAAFTRPGGPDAHQLANDICPTCTTAPQCLAWAMTHGEYGTWGGATQRQRTNAGAPPARSSTD